MSMAVSSPLWVAMFAIFYLAYVILFAEAPRGWEPDQSRHYYRYTGIAAPRSIHLTVDKIQLGVT